MAGPGGADTCGCAGCRNFKSARGHAYPPEFLTLLKSLGVDPLKDAEVFHMGWDEATAGHQYGGWFHFVGRLESNNTCPPDREGQVIMLDQLTPHLQFALSRAAGEPGLLGVDSEDLIHLEFYASGVPWVLDEDEIR